MPAETAFALEGVTKGYHVWRQLRRTRARGITGVSLAVPRGIVFGLLGLNGAGKTTTMKLLVGLLRPEAGRVRVLDGGPEDAAIRARAGYLPELPYLPLHLKAGELLRAYGRMSGLAGRHLENRVAAALDAAGLPASRAARDPLRLFSKGMQQRVAVAQALLHAPELLFADEPVSGLDPQGIREMREMLLRLKAAGVTVCLNSHQIAEVERVCDRVAVLADGRLAGEDTVGGWLAGAGARRYRLVLLGRARPGAGPARALGEELVEEARLPAALAAHRRAGTRVLQILTERGSLEEVVLAAIRRARAARPEAGA